MVWFGLEGSKSSTVSESVSHQGMYRAARAAKKVLELHICTMPNSRTHNMIQKEEEVEIFLDKTLIEQLGCSRSQHKHSQTNYKHKIHINTLEQNTENMPDLKVPFASRKTI